MALLFNMLSKLVIAFLPRQASFNYMAAVNICSNFGAQENKVGHVSIVSTFSLPVCHEEMERDAMISIF